MSLKMIAARSVLKIKKYSPEILLGVGIIAGGCAIVSACKATPKAKELISKRDSDIRTYKRVKEEYPDEKYSNEDLANDIKIANVQTAVKVVKTYLPTVTLEVLSIGCILAGFGILRKRHVALLGLYKALEESFLDYRKRVIAKEGEGMDQLYRLGLTEETVAEKIIDEKTGKEKTKNVKKVVVDPNQHSQYAKFFDESSIYWKKDAEQNYFFLKTQQAYANDILRTRGHIFLNEIYDMLGLPRTQAGQLVGWVKGQGDDFVDFGIFDGDDMKHRDFVNGYERSILLDFNVDGIVYNLI